MIVLPTDLPARDRYKVLIGAVVPRPIAWVSTVGPGGVANLAPFSYFNAMSADPMALVFSVGLGPGGEKKDTLRNIETSGEFVVNLPDEATAEAMNLSATALPYGQSEFAWAGVTSAASQVVQPPRVAEAPVAFECTLHQIVPLGENSAIFGLVQAIYVRDDIYVDGYVDIARYRPIGRLAGSGYTRVTYFFEMERVPAPSKD